MRRQVVLSGLVLAALAGAAAVQGSEDTGHIKVLGADTFEDATNDGSVYFVKMFAPWCGHCKRLAPTWKDLAAEFKDSPTIKIAHVDCTVDRDVCTAAEVKGYPTLLTFFKGEKIGAYRGARELDALKSYIREAADDLLTETAE